MSKFYIIQNVYKPNEATINRLLAFLRAFDKQGVNAIVVFLMPDNDHDVIKEHFNHISIKYMWTKYTLTGRRLKYLSGFINAFRLKRLLKPGDKVLMFDVCYWDIIFSCKSVDFYYESTECPEVKNYYTLPFDKKLKRYFKYCRKLKGLFVISTGLKAYFVSKGIAPNKISIVNMIVDSSRFDNLKKENTFPYIAYCGTASNNKDGVDHLIKSFELFSKSHDDVKLYIIGKTPSKSQAFDNANLVEELGIVNKVVFTGCISAEKMPQILKNATILALDRPDNKQAYYGFPTKLGEYLSTANPVVLTNVGDISLFLEDGISAFISKPNDEISFSDKLSFAYDNPDIASKIGVEGRKVAIANFNSNIEAKKIVDFIFN